MTQNLRIELASHLPEAWNQWSRFIVLSPHCDDAAFSLAATLCALSQARKEITLVTCFSISQFSLTLRESPVEFVTAVRKQEDRSFCAMVGARCRPVWLDLHDAPLRGYRLTSVRSGAALSPEDFLLSAQIIDAIASDLSNECATLCPLGIGLHIDHRIVHRAALELVRSGIPVIFFEDMPYSATVPEDDIMEAIHHIEEQLPYRLVPASISCPGTLRAKIMAAHCYPSQVAANRATAIISDGGTSTKYGTERVWQVTV